MTAAVKTATIAGAPISNGAAKSATGVVEGIYTVTTAATLDWTILTDFSEILWAKGYITATGAESTVYVSTTTTNQVYITGTGANTLFIKGTPA